MSWPIARGASVAMVAIVAIVIPLAIAAYEGVSE